MAKEKAKTVSGISIDVRDLIVSQAIKEIQWARRYKQGKIRNWQKNEQMYYGKKVATTDSRANVDLSRMQEFVHTLLSKIDNSLTFKFTKRKESQLKRVALLNSLKTYDSDRNGWDMKDLVGKKQGIVYGRAVYHYNAESENGGYRPDLCPTDVYDFLIDPSCGGYDIEIARFMGDWGVSLTRQDLEVGIEQGIYDKPIVDQILQGDGNNTDKNQEETNKQARNYDQNTIGQKEIQSDDKFKFWRWHTTFYNKETKTSERYYLVMQEKSGGCIRIEKLEDLFTPTEEFPKSAWPYWTWAAFPDLTEFWTPSYCDYARELFLAQYTTINQMLDNAEAVNKPQKAVVVGDIENPNELKYRRDGIIKVKKGGDINKSVQMLVVPSIDTPLKVFEALEAIYEKALGVTPIETGNANQEGKVAIYEGNQAQNADRFGLLNKSYGDGYKRFARLYEVGVRDHLVKKIAIDIVGPDGIEVIEVKKSDIFKRADRFALMVEASNAEFMASKQKQETKLAFLSAHTGDPVPIQNPKKAYEMEARVAGFNEDEIKQLMDMSEFGNAELMSECDADIESILEGEKVILNQSANAAYAQKMKNWVGDHIEELKGNGKFEKLIAYMKAIVPIVIRNEHRALRTFAVNQMNTGNVGAGAPADAETPGSTGLPEFNNNQPVR